MVFRLLEMNFLVKYLSCPSGKRSASFLPLTLGKGKLLPPVNVIQKIYFPPAERWRKETMNA